VLGMALTLHAEIGCGAPPEGARAVDEHHPATIAFRRLGGDGPVWERSPIPMARGLGYSGAVRIGGAIAALFQRGVDPLADASRQQVLEVVADLEGHADNAAASLYGGIVAAAGDDVARVPMVLDPAIVVWIPGETTTSTDQSRHALPDLVARADAVFNLARVAMFVVACATGDIERLRSATEDRLHQAPRLAKVPSSAEALRTAVEAGAWAAWLSGSGPTVATMCDDDAVADVVAALPADGHTKVLRIDHDGAAIVGVEPAPGEPR
jgi:homoserine kinase